MVKVTEIRSQQTALGGFSVIPGDVSNYEMSRDHAVGGIPQTIRK